MFSISKTVEKYLIILKSTLDVVDKILAVLIVLLGIMLFNEFEIFITTRNLFISICIFNTFSIETNKI